EEDQTQYNNTNRAFLQAFLARSTLTFEEAKPILAAIFTAHGKLGFLPRVCQRPTTTNALTRKKRDIAWRCHGRGFPIVPLRREHRHLALRL
ncbi:MAG: hypothetical protein M1830_006320, partial [Pleopsidium flavum]